jgi:prepilin peptidase CpaA
MQTVTIHVPHAVAYPILAAWCALLLLFLCVAVAHSDVKRRHIPNRYCAAIAALALVWWVGQGGRSGLLDFTCHLIIPLLVAGPLLGFFAIGILAGGDVKLLLALLLWVPADGVGAMLVVMVLTGGLLGMVILVLRRIFASVKGDTVPYGVPIIFGALVVLMPDLRDVLGSYFVAPR